MRINKSTRRPYHLSSMAGHDRQTDRQTPRPYGRLEELGGSHFASVGWRDELVNRHGERTGICFHGARECLVTGRFFVSVILSKSCLFWRKYISHDVDTTLLSSARACAAASSSAKSLGTFLSFEVLIRSAARSFGLSVTSGNPGIPSFIHASMERFGGSSKRCWMSRNVGYEPAPLLASSLSAGEHANCLQMELIIVCLSVSLKPSCQSLVCRKQKLYYQRELSS